MSTEKIPSRRTSTLKVYKKENIKGEPNNMNEESVVLSNTISDSSVDIQSHYYINNSKSTISQSTSSKGFIRESNNEAAQLHDMGLSFNSSSCHSTLLSILDSFSQYQNNQFSYSTTISNIALALATNRFIFNNKMEQNTSDQLFKVLNNCISLEEQTPSLNKAQLLRLPEIPIKFKVFKPKKIFNSICINGLYLCTSTAVNLHKLNSSPDYNNISINKHRSQLNDFISQTGTPVNIESDNSSILIDQNSVSNQSKTPTNRTSLLPHSIEIFSEKGVPTTSNQEHDRAKSIKTNPNYNDNNFHNDNIQGNPELRFSRDLQEIGVNSLSMFDIASRDYICTTAGLEHLIGTNISIEEIIKTLFDTLKNKNSNLLATEISKLCNQICDMQVIKHQQYSLKTHDLVFKIREKGLALISLDDTNTSMPRPGHSSISDNSINYLHSIADQLTLKSSYAKEKTNSLSNSTEVTHFQDSTTSDDQNDLNSSQKTGKIDEPCTHSNCQKNRNLDSFEHLLCGNFTKEIKDFSALLLLNYNHVISVAIFVNSLVAKRIQNNLILQNSKKKPSNNIPISPPPKSPQSINTHVSREKSKLVTPLSKSLISIGLPKPQELETNTKLKVENETEVDDLKSVFHSESAVDILAPLSKHELQLLTKDNRSSDILGTKKKVQTAVDTVLQEPDGLMEYSSRFKLGRGPEKLFVRSISSRDKRTLAKHFEVIESYKNKDNSLEFSNESLDSLTKLFEVSGIRSKESLIILDRVLVCLLDARDKLSVGAFNVFKKKMIEYIAYQIDYACIAFTSSSKSMLDRLKDHKLERNFLRALHFKALRVTVNILNMRYLSSSFKIKDTAKNLKHTLNNDIINKPMSILTWEIDESRSQTNTSNSSELVRRPDTNFLGLTNFNNEFISRLENFLGQDPNILLHRALIHIITETADVSLDIDENRFLVDDINCIGTKSLERELLKENLSKFSGPITTPKITSLKYVPIEGLNYDQIPVGSVLTPLWRDTDWYLTKGFIEPCSLCSRILRKSAKKCTPTEQLISNYLDLISEKDSNLAMNNIDINSDMTLKEEMQNDPYTKNSDRACNEICHTASSDYMNMGYITNKNVSLINPTIILERYISNKNYKEEICSYPKTARILSLKSVFYTSQISDISSINKDITTDTSNNCTLTKSPVGVDHSDNESINVMKHSRTLLQKEDVRQNPQNNIFELSNEFRLLETESCLSKIYGSRLLSSISVSPAFEFKTVSLSSPKINKNIPAQKLDEEPLLRYQKANPAQVVLELAQSRSRDLLSILTEISQIEWVLIIILEGLRSLSTVGFNNLKSKLESLISNGRAQQMNLVAFSEETNSRFTDLSFLEKATLINNKSTTYLGLFKFAKKNKLLLKKFLSGYKSRQKKKNLYIKRSRLSNTDKELKNISENTNLDFNFQSSWYSDNYTKVRKLKFQNGLLRKENEKSLELPRNGLNCQEISFAEEYNELIKGIGTNCDHEIFEIKKEEDSLNKFDLSTIWPSFDIPLKRNKTINSEPNYGEFLSPFTKNYADNQTLRNTFNQSQTTNLITRATGGYMNRFMCTEDMSNYSAVEQTIYKKKMRSQVASLRRTGNKFLMKTLAKNPCSLPIVSLGRILKQYLPKSYNTMVNTLDNDSNIISILLIVSDAIISGFWPLYFSEQIYACGKISKSVICSLQKLLVSSRRACRINAFNSKISKYSIVCPKELLYLTRKACSSVLENYGIPSIPQLADALSSRPKLLQTTLFSIDYSAVKSITEKYLSQIWPATTYIIDKISSSIGKLVKKKCIESKADLILSKSSKQPKLWLEAVLNQIVIEVNLGLSKFGDAMLVRNFINSIFQTSNYDTGIFRICYGLAAAFRGYAIKSIPQNLAIESITKNFNSFTHFDFAHSKANASFSLTKKSTVLEPEYYEKFAIARNTQISSKNILNETLSQEICCSTNLSKESSRLLTTNSETTKEVLLQNKKYVNKSIPKCEDVRADKVNSSTSCCLGKTIGNMNDEKDLSEICLLYNEPINHNQIYFSKILSSYYRRRKINKTNSIRYIQDSSFSKNSVELSLQFSSRNNFLLNILKMSNSTDVNERKNLEHTEYLKSYENSSKSEEKSALSKNLAYRNFTNSWSTQTGKSNTACLDNNNLKNISQPKISVLSDDRIRDSDKIINKPIWSLINQNNLNNLSDTNYTSESTNTVEIIGSYKDPCVISDLYEDIKSIYLKYKNNSFPIISSVSEVKPQRKNCSDEQNISMKQSNCNESNIKSILQEVDNEESIIGGKISVTSPSKTNNDNEYFDTQKKTTNKKLRNNKNRVNKINEDKVSKKIERLMQFFPNENRDDDGVSPPALIDQVTKNHIAAYMRLLVMYPEPSWMMPGNKDNRLEKYISESLPS